MILVFTPAKYHGGLDVAYASIERQDLTEEVVWLICDDLYQERKKAVHDRTRFASFRVLHVDSEEFRRGDNPRTLAASYNHAIDTANHHGADMLVSLQDYIWAPPNGFARFRAMATSIDGLLTGRCSISADPGTELVTDPEGAWTIFGSPTPGWWSPNHVDWADVRRADQVWSKVSTQWWETNWAAITKGPLQDHELRFDESYDEGVAYENQDYAEQAIRLRYEVWMDADNHAVSLPHKRYFPDLEAADMKLSNRERHERKWEGVGV